MPTNSLFDGVAKSFSAPDQGNTWDQYQDDIDRIAKEEGVDPKWVTAIVRAESGGKKLALSDKGAQGLMQLMPPTAKEMGVTDSNDPLQNIRGGSRYFKQQMDAHGGDPSLALAAYNAGPGNVKKYGGIPPFEETQEYVKKVQAYYAGKPYQKPQAVKPVNVPGSDQPAANMFDAVADKFSQPPAQEQGSIYDNPPPPGADTLNLGLPQAQAPALGRSQQGRLSSAGGSFMRGVGDIIASLPKAIGEGAVQLANKFGDDPIWGNPDKVTPEETTAYQAGEAIEKWFNKFAVNPEYRDEFWTSKIAQGAGSMFGFLMGGAAGKIAEIPALVTTMGLGATATGVEGVDDYLATLAKDEKASPQMREQAFNWNAVLGTSEGLPITQILNRLDNISGGGVKKILKEGVTGGIEELTQEVLQSFGQNAIASRILKYDPERGLFTGTAEAGQVGFTLGFALNTLAATIGSRRAGNTGAPPPADDLEVGQTGVTGHITDALAAADVPVEDGGLPALAGDAISGQQGSDIPPPEAAEGDQDQTGPVPGVGATGDALQRESETQGPADEVPTPKISYFDNRLKRESFRFGLEEMKNDLQVGGDVSYITDEQGAITGRTPSLNPDWYQGMMDNPEYRLKGGVKGVWGAVDKALAGERLGVRQSRVIEGMLDQVTGERTTPENLEYARKQLEIAREARAGAGMPDSADWLFEEEDYPDEADGLTRTFMELQANAHDMSPELGAQVDDLMESQQDDATILTAIIEATERYNRGRQSEISGQVDQAAQAQAGLPDTGQEPIPGEPAPAGVPGPAIPGVPADRYAEQGARPEPAVAPAPRPEITPPERGPAGAEFRKPPAAKAAPAAPEAAAVEGRGEQAEPWEMTREEYRESASLSDVSSEIERKAGTQNLQEIADHYSKKYNLPKIKVVIEDTADIRSASTKKTVINGKTIYVVTLPGRLGGNESLGLKGRLAEILRHEIEHTIDREVHGYDSGKAFGDTSEDTFSKYEHGTFTQDYSHRSAVKRALKEGKDVPDRVLKDYPDLAKKEEPAKAAPAEDRRQKKQPGRKKERRTAAAEQRRRNWAFRKDIDQMSAPEKKAVIEELRQVARVNKLTGLPGRELWEDEMLPAALERGDWILSIDADSLGWVNDNLGAEAGDLLLVEVGNALKAEFGKAVAHKSGDEFWGYGADKTQLEAMAKAAQEALKTASLEHEGSTVTGFAFSYGITKDATSADRAMKADKKAREAAGDRVAKTSRPKGVVLKGEREATTLLRGPEAAVEPEAEKPKKKAPGKKGEGILPGESVELGARRIYVNEITAPTDTNPGRVFTTTIEKRQSTGKWIPATDSKPQEWSWGAFQRATGRYPNVSQDTGKKAPGKKQPDKYQAGVEKELDELEAATFALGAPEGEVVPDEEKVKRDQIDLVDEANEAATSPENAEPLPTPGQKEAGNYKKGHISILGLDISIENPAGSMRTGTDSDGETWSQKMANHYGYIKRTEGADGDHVDVFLADNAADAGTVFVIDQINPDTNTFDEHKVVIGPDNQEAAHALYQANYEKGWQGAGAITEMDLGEFKEWIKTGDTTKPLLFKEKKAPGKKPVKAKKPVIFKIGDLVKSPDPFYKGKTYRVDFIKGSDENMTLVLADTETKERPFGNASYNASDFTKVEPKKAPGKKAAEKPTITREGFAAALEMDSEATSEKGVKYTVEHPNVGGYVYSRAEDGYSVTTGSPSPTGGGWSRELAIEKATDDAYGAEVEAAPSPTEGTVTLNEGQKKLARDISLAIARPQKLSWREFFAMADKAFGGTQADGVYSSKDAYDAMELGFNKYITRHEGAIDPSKASLKSAQDTVSYLETLMDLLPTQSKRSEEQQEYQQFSTPPTHSFVVAWVANIGKNDVILEPSAGTGSLIAPAANASPAAIYANELAEGRANLLEKTLPIDKITRENAAHLNAVLPKTIKPNVVIMNPPFSADANTPGKKNTMVGANHVEQALKRLEPGGRLVAIVGRGMAMGKPTFNKWWRKIQGEYNVLANIGISGKEYRKYGTSFDNQILVIDKTGQTTGTVVTGNVDKVADLLQLLQEVRNGRVPATERATDQQAVEGGPEVAQAVTGAGAAVQPAADEQRPVAEELPPDAGEPGRPAGDGGRPAVGRSSPVDEIPAGDRPGGTSAASESGIDAAGVSAITAGEPAQQNGGDVGQLPDDTPGADSAAGKITKAKKEKTKELGESSFEEYSPQIAVKGAKKHPTTLAESAAMGMVTMPDIDYQPDLPENIIESGKLSSVQIEAIAYAGAAHSVVLPNGERKGFYIGDGTGVGKGAEVSGIILDNWNNGRKKAVWVSENQKLANDAKRDLDWVGMDADKVLVKHGGIKAGTDIKSNEGVLFTTYSTLAGSIKEVTDADGNVVKPGTRRLDQLVEWLGKDFDGVIAFDEAHNMGNALDQKGKRGMKKASKKALSGIELQAALPNARVVYVSATAATEVYNLAYADRLGLWGDGTPFADKADFIAEIKEGGVAAMEVVAKDMKAMGLYVARSLSYDEVSYDTLEHELTDAQTGIYNTLATAWQGVLNDVGAALEDNNSSSDSGAKSAALSSFWGSHQRFFNQVITAMQTPSIIKDVEVQLGEGNSAVLQLVNTNEAIQERRMAQAADQGMDLEDIDLTPRDILMQYVARSFPTTLYEDYIDDNGNESTRPVTDSEGNVVKNPDSETKRDELLEKLGGIAVPEGVLEQIINHFGSDAVAEITGRKRRLVRQPSGKVVEEKLGTAKSNNDAKAFMAGKKRILIFSDAGGTGRSYHADLREKNQQRRVHYLVQPGWRADKAVQGFGRTHRTNQAVAPHYKLVTTNLKAQKRFLSSIARRLDQLGALSKGQRDTANQGMFDASMNLENEYAEMALQTLLEDVFNGRAMGLDLNVIQNEMGMQIVDEVGNLKQDLNISVPKFLNRLLSLNTDSMDVVFDTFFSRLQANVEYAREQGTLDTGMETLTAAKVEKIEETVVPGAEQAAGRTLHAKFAMTDPVRFNQFDDLYKDATRQFGKNQRSGKIYAFYNAVSATDKDGSIIKRYERVGTSGHSYIKAAELEKRYDMMTLLSDTEIRAEWNTEIEESPKERTKNIDMITGALLPVWDRLPEGNAKIYRTITDEGERVVGRYIRPTQLKDTLKRLGLEVAIPDKTPEQFIRGILKDGDKIELANGWRLQRSRVSGEDRVELKGASYPDYPSLKERGLFTEVVNYTTRAFLPTDKAGSILDYLIESKPIVDVQTVTDTETPQLSREAPVISEYATSSKKKPAGMSVNEVQGVIDGFVKGFRKGLNLQFRVAADKQAAFGAAAAELVDGPPTKGGYYPKSRIAVLVASDLENKADALATLRHEIITHHGLNTFTPSEKRKILDAVSNSRSATSLKEIWRKVDRDYQELDETGRAEEVIARIAESKQGRLTKAWSAIVRAIRSAMRAIGLINNTTTQTEVKGLINSIERRLVRGEPMRTFPESDTAQFQESEQAARVFFSQMRAVLAEKLNATGKTKSFKDQIDSFRKKGLFKNEEYEWSGINEWLDSMVGRKISKAEVLQFMDANRIQVTDVLKGARGGEQSTLSRLEEMKTRLRSEYGIGIASDNEGYPASFVPASGPFAHWPFESDDNTNGLIDENGEIDDAVLADFYKANDFTKNTSLDHLITNFIKTAMEVRRDDDMGYQDTAGTVHDEWVLPGGKDYQELLLTLPPPDWMYEGRADAPSVAAEAKVFRSTHYREPNILAHTRFNTRTDADGNRILFLEEVQSDWHQKGRKKGYKTGDRPVVERLKKKYGLDDDHTRWQLDVLRRKGVSEEDIVDWTDERSAYISSVPNAPFKTTWAMLAMKRMIRYAADNGYDKIAWTTGEQQNKRYNLSNYISELTYVVKGVPGKSKSNTLYAKARDGRWMPTREVQLSELDEHVGEGMSNEIRSRIDAGENTVNITDLDLDVSVRGRGMVGFYDKMLPNQINKYVKKWGAKAGVTEIPTLEMSDSAKKSWARKGAKIPAMEVHSIDITPEMKAAATQEQPMFAKGERRTPGREYTGEQEEAMEAGGFGDDTMERAQQNPLMRALGAARDRLEESKQVWKTILRQGFLDQYDSFRTIIDDKRAWMTAQLSESAGGVIEAALEYGRPFMNQSAVDVDVTKDSLSDILEPLGLEVNDWLKWIAGNRAERLATEDRERLFSETNIDALISLSEGTMADGRNRAEVYESVRVEFEKMNDAFVKIGVDTGIIGRDERKQWKQEGFYVPFYRLAQEASDKVRGPYTDRGLVRQTAYKRLTGADIQINDLLTNVIMNWTHITSAGLKNQAAVQAIASAEEMGLAEQVEESDKSKDAVFVRLGGKKVWLELDQSKEGQLVLESLMSLNYEGMNNFMMKLARKFKRILTYGVTASPEFKAANLIRDSVQAVAVAGMSTNIAKNITQGFRATGKNNPTIARMIAGGGAFGDSGYIHGSDPEALNRLIKKDIDRMTILDSPGNIKKMWDMYQDFGARLENVNRASNFEQDLSRGVDLLTANFNARDHLDFQRSGAFKSIRIITQVVPFLNARLQGIDKLARSGMDPEQRKQFGAVVGVYALASTLLYLYMKDDDDYDEAPQWERDTYHLFKIPGSDTMYRIPRPFEVGFIASMVERATEQMVNDEVHGRLFFERLWHGLAETLSFNPVPQMIMPAMEVWANKNTFTDRQIESEGMKNMSPAERRRAWTSDTAIAMSKGFDAILWDDVVLSPVQIEHLVNGYFGWIGGTILESIDGIVRNAGLTPSSPEWRVQDYPLVGRFARTGPTRGTRYLTEFYENMRDANRAYADIRFAMQLGDTEKAKRIAKEEKDVLVMRKGYTGAQRSISNINKQIMMVRIKKMSAEKKRIEIERLTKQKNAISKTVIERTNQ